MKERKRKEEFKNERMVLDKDNYSYKILDKAAENSYDYISKVLLIGEFNVGKSSILSEFADNK